MLRLFAISDLHVDYRENKNWVNALSKKDYQNDFLILSGDISSRFSLFKKTLDQLNHLFKSVFFVFGNHDLWIEPPFTDSLEKWFFIKKDLEKMGIILSPYFFESIFFVPLFSWYDFSFGSLNEPLVKKWTDFKKIKWPGNKKYHEITNYFLKENQKNLLIYQKRFLKTNKQTLKKVITFSHFLPRIDLLPSPMPKMIVQLQSVLGCQGIEKQIRQINSNLHIYGHLHAYQSAFFEGVHYLNSAFGYPREAHLTKKALLEINV